MNHIKTLKTISGLNYKDLSQMLSEVGIKISASSMAVRASRDATKPFNEDEIDRLRDGVMEPETELTAAFAANVKNAEMFISKYLYPEANRGVVIDDLSEDTEESFLESDDLDDVSLLLDDDELLDSNSNHDDDFGAVKGQSKFDDGLTVDIDDELDLDDDEFDETDEDLDDIETDEDLDNALDDDLSLDDDDDDPDIDDELDDLDDSILDDDEDIFLDGDDDEDLSLDDPDEELNFDPDEIDINALNKVDVDKLKPTVQEKGDEDTDEFGISEDDMDMADDNEDFEDFDF